MVIAGMRGNVEDPEGMVEAIDGRFDAMGGKAEAMLAIGGGRVATIGGRPLDGLALDSGPDRLPGWQSKNKTKWQKMNKRRQKEDSKISRNLLWQWHHCS